MTKTIGGLFFQLLFSATALLIIFSITGCDGFQQKTDSLPFDPADNPWPEIRNERIAKLLPAAMQRAEVDAWVVICRENNNDPLASHVGCENAGGTAAFMFFLEGNNVRSLAFSPEGEAKSLQDVGIHDEVIQFERGGNVFNLVAEELNRVNPKVIAINSSQRNIADGLSYTQRIKLENALGFVLMQRLVSSQNLVT